MTKDEIKNRLTANKSLFNNIYMVEQKFDIIPNDHTHFGASIAYQDIFELRTNFLEQLVDTVVDWVYSSEKYEDLKRKYVSTGKSEGAAVAEVIRKAAQKFRHSDDKLLIQGQLGELLLFHFIQHIKQAVPLLRKMSITTSSEHERYGADAIHYKVDGKKNIIILGEAKAYTSKYQFSTAFEKAIISILDAYIKLRKELNLYLHEDFLDKDLDEVAEKFLNNQLPNVQIELVSLVLFDETQKLDLSNEAGIKKQIEKIIQDRYSSFDKSKIDIENNPILKRITYIIFPIWKFDELAEEFQKMI